MINMSDYRIGWIIGYGGDRLDYRIQGKRKKGGGGAVGNQLLRRDVFKQIHSISGPEF